MNNEKDFLKNGKMEKPETKEDLQIKKLKLQIEQLEEKKRQQAQKQVQTSKLQTTRDIIKALLYIGIILLAPLFIMGGFLLACAKASGGTRRGRKY